ncbi:nuclear pore membrane glycoprotein 210-like [Amblyraja radiata]|uniref:nuclear pore membrane glycoprotein 210-like n=1 Tax=Amblyraja radiata TaxID=386614 RepID=UPI001403CA7A|nr:nuclear pore membrane glycoprotein 210-like [Amblyraja radiata]
MAMGWAPLLLLALLPRHMSGAKLNVPKVLLPYSSTVKVNFTLQADEGCYGWFSTRPDIATIEPVYQNNTDCSNSAVISARSTQRTRLTSIIIAEETVTGQVLRCDVMVDKINQIEILSTTRELYVDDSLLKLTVRALDEEGNTFSCLEGFIFVWSIVKNENSDNNAESPRKIRILKFSESPYLPSAHIEKMEREGKQGDIILVSGLMTGTANLNARLHETIYKRVPAATIRLIILENIILSPAHDIYLLVGAFIHYRVTKIVNGIMTEVNMPSEQYRLELHSDKMRSDGEGNATVAKLDSDSSIVTAVHTGRANLVLTYKNIHMQALSHLPNSTIYVVEVGFLALVHPGFFILPGERWVLEVERKYEFTVEIYDKRSNKVYLSDNLNIATVLPQSHFQTLKTTRNGSYHYVNVMLAGHTEIKATLFGVVGQYLTTPITNSQAVIIYNSIILEPSILVFPWHPKPRCYRHIIKVIGGSGNFTWSSSNETVALVTVKGLIATGDSRGFSIIRARDVENAIHFGEMQVNVLRPVSIEFVQSRVEAEVAQYLYLWIMVYGLKETDDMETVPVNDCSLMNLAVDMDKQGVFRVIQGKLEADATHCTGISVQAETPGHTLLTASAAFLEVHFSSSISIASYHRLRVSIYDILMLSTETLEHGGGCGLRSLGVGDGPGQRSGGHYPLWERPSIPLAITEGDLLSVSRCTACGRPPALCIRRLSAALRSGRLRRHLRCGGQAIDPVAVAIVTLTSSKEMLFEGGPRPWVLEPSGFFMDLTGEKKKKITIEQQWAPSMKKKSHHGFRVTCVALGEQFLTFKVGNQPSLLNLNPAVEDVKVKLVCAVPTSVTLAPVYKSRERGLPCPLLQHNKQLVPVSFCRNTILELTAYDQYGRKFDNFTSLFINWKSSNSSLGSLHPTLLMEMILRDDGSGQKRLHGHRMVTVYRKKGTVSISVYLVGYQKTPTDFFPEVNSLFVPITASIDLLLVDDVSLVPRNLTVYNHPDILEVIYLTEGSGYFFVNTTDAEVLTSTYMEAKNYVQVKPLQPGIVTLKAYDLCLTCKGPARAEIHVSDILDFELDLIHKIEVGKSVAVNVRILDFFKQPFLNRYFHCMNISLQAASPIVTLEAISNLDKHAASYMMRAVTLGQTTLVATVKDKNCRKLSSSPRQIEVFPPFRLIPRRVTLIIGGMIQVMSEGGPQPQSNIYFSINNHTIAKVNKLGQLTALVVGTAKMTGIVQAIDDDTGRVVVFSQDEVTVEVIRLKGIKIHAPVTRLRTGTQVPVYVTGITSSQTPFSFGNGVPGLTFHWTTTKREVIEIVTRHSEISLELSAEHNFAMLLHSRAQGKTGLKVTVNAQDPSAGQFEKYVDMFSDEIQIMVFGILQLLPLSLPAEEVLMSPNSQLKLQTSRDGKALVSYEVRKCPNNKSVIMEDGHGLLMSGHRTGSSALTVTSREYFGLNQTIVTGVRVAPVAYLSIVTSPMLYITKNEELTALPLGMTLTFTVNFYDLSGDQFHAHNTELYLALNRDDLLLIGPGTSNNTYVAQAANVGLTILAVWDNKHPGIADYIPIPIQYAIWPNISEHVVLSDVICFSSVLVNQEGEPGNWYVLSNEVLQIDSGTGLGVTRGTGSTTVYYEIPGIVKTYRELTVTGVGKASISFHGFKHIVGLPKFNVYRFIVTTMNKDSSLRGDCSFAQIKATSKLKPESNLACSVRFNNIVLQVFAGSVFSVEPEFIADTGQYSCTVMIKELPDAVFRELSTGGDTYVSVKASVLGGHYAGQVGRTEIPFIPGFYMNQSTVSLSHKEPLINITIFGIDRVLNELEVQSQSSAIVVSEPIKLLAVPNIVYTLSPANVSLLQLGMSCTNISVSSPLTRQVMHVAVTVLRTGSSSGTRDLSFEEPTFFDQLVESYQVLMFTLFAVLATTAVIFIAYNAFLTRIQTIPVIYVSAPQQAGYTSAPHCSNPRRRYLQSWLWSVR